jgi:acetolactate synthase-1/2/3 large subunit
MSRASVARALVDCLEAEGVRWVFGIPGEETLDLSQALADSAIEFVPVRHEQAAAFMASVYGRLTGRAGVCLGTLGPGATNLLTGVADAQLDRSPLVALTGQGDLERMHKESHQYLDVVGLMKPVSKWNARLADPAITSELVRKAFKVAETEKPGATHIELPEDVMAAPGEIGPLPRRATVQPRAPEDEIARAAGLIHAAQSPLVLAGNGAVRGGASSVLRSFVATTGLPVAETFMGKGLLDAYDPHALGSVGLQAGDYTMAGFEAADLVVTIGYDLVEHAPSHWNPDRDKRIVCLDSVPAETDADFVPDVELIGDLCSTVARLGEVCGPVAGPGGSPRLREAVLGRFDRATDDPAVPMQPPRVLAELRKVLDRDDMLVSDVGLHKLWVGRMFPAHEPGTVLIANGLAGMGFGLPAAIAAKLVHPQRTVAVVSGDGGFLMNAAELETAVRLGTPIVCVIWEDHRFGSIAWKQDKAFGRHFDVDFSNPDFVELARSFGAYGWRCDSADDLATRLAEAVTADRPTVLTLPIDYSLDVAIADELGEETVAT